MSLRRQQVGKLHLFWRGAILFALLGVVGTTTVWLQAADAQQLKVAQAPNILPGWDISGSNTLRLEEYVIGGNETASPFPFDGFQPYNELFINFSNRISPYERWSGNFGGVVSDSEYRTADTGVTVERLNLTWEKGDSRVPYRAEVGDYFGFFSERTLRRSLKGGQLEVQPLGGLVGERDSIVALTGFVSPTYRNVDVLDDYYTGLSWLIEQNTLGLFAINGLYNFRQADRTSPDRDQWVVSLAGERRFQVGAQQLTLEGEIAGLFGDVGTGTATREGTSDAGYFAKLSGLSASPLTYSLRFEQYGADYQPNGAQITPNRRTWDLRGGWRFADGFRIDGRLQSFRDGLQGASLIDTDTAGVTFSGPVPFGLLPGVTGRLDGWIQDRESDDRTTDSLTQELRLDVNAPAPGNWVVRIGSTLQSVDDQAAGQDTTTVEANVSADKAVTILGLNGTVSPGLLIRNISDGTDSFDLGPAVNLSLQGDNHSLGANYNLLRQDREGSSDIYTHNAAVTYEYRIDNHTFGVDVQFQNRNPSLGESTDSFKVGIFWRIDFERPAPRRRIGTPRAAPTGPVGPFRLTNLTPGLSLAAVQQELTRTGITGGVSLPQAEVFETRVLEEIIQRQRLVVVFAGGRVAKTGLIIDFQDVGDVDTVAQTFERVRQALILRYDTPNRTFEEGGFSPSLVQDVNNDRFIRNSEWDTASGVLRFGIPRRLDRQVRMEVQLAPRFPPPRRTVWSIEVVR